MFLQRLIVAIVLLPIGLFALFGGEVSFAILMAIVTEIAVWEYCRLFRIGGYKPAGFLLFGGVLVIYSANLLIGQPAGLFSYVLFGLMIAGWHLWQYERGRDLSLLDALVSMTGLFLVGFLGGFFILLRSLPGGEWWVLVVLSTVWLADVGGYLFGSWLGKNLIAPRISPKKTWEGYVAGVFVSVIGSPLLLLLYQRFQLPVYETITYKAVILLAVVMSVVSILGDLFISLFKRYFGEKDTGKILPGHGGILDRMDSWIWAVALGYYLITAIILS